MSGRRSRDKGARAERALVRFLQQRGFSSQRVPLSGAAGGRYVGDVSIPLLGRDLCAEVKCRATGFAQLYAWLDDRDLLVVRADRREPLVVIPLRLAADIAAVAERKRGES
jgi:Holliday junction resolvase